MGSLENLKGKFDYEKQRIAFILENGAIIGLCFICDYYEIIRTTIIDISEITLFRKEDIKRVLPFVIKSVMKERSIEEQYFLIRIETMKDS